LKGVFSQTNGRAGERSRSIAGAARRAKYSALLWGQFPIGFVLLDSSLGRQNFGQSVVATRHLALRWRERSPFLNTLLSAFLLIGW
jgi:hypothetical protein